ncbi:unnamed protein product [Cyclocybe aegerita]|uniref:Uncharacterized protein n=1 Tax=Cyclocybe aegerita TaxID=1973307 RepID=A0A8S0WMT9_CYCAE|nr:unnamed protein product [Cyclocybe aegerita]
MLEGAADLAAYQHHIDNAFGPNADVDKIRHVIQSLHGQKRLGVEDMLGPDEGHSADASFETNSIRLQASFYDSKTPQDRAGTLIHEAVHALHSSAHDSFTKDGHYKATPSSDIPMGESSNFYDGLKGGANSEQQLLDHTGRDFETLKKHSKNMHLNPDSYKLLAHTMFYGFMRTNQQRQEGVPHKVPLKADYEFYRSGKHLKEHKKLSGPEWVPTPQGQPGQHVYYSPATQRYDGPYQISDIPPPLDHQPPHPIDLAEKPHAFSGLSRILPKKPTTFGFAGFHKKTGPSPNIGSVSSSSAAGRTGGTSFLKYMGHLRKDSTALRSGDRSRATAAKNNNYQLSAGKAKSGTARSNEAGSRKYAGPSGRHGRTGKKALKSTTTMGKARESRARHMPGATSRDGGKRGTQTPLSHTGAASSTSHAIHKGTRIHASAVGRTVAQTMSKTKHSVIKRPTKLSVAHTTRKAQRGSYSEAATSGSSAGRSKTVPRQSRTHHTAGVSKGNAPHADRTRTHVAHVEVSPGRKSATSARRLTKVAQRTSKNSHQSRAGKASHPAVVGHSKSRTATGTVSSRHGAAKPPPSLVPGMSTRPSSSMKVEKRPRSTEGLA